MLFIVCEVMGHVLGEPYITDVAALRGAVKVPATHAALAYRPPELATQPEKFMDHI